MISGKGRGWKSVGGKGSKSGKKAASAAPVKKDWVRKVPWNDRLSKYYLRPYVDRTGSPFVSGSLEERDLLSSWNFGSVMNETCSEYCGRQGVALSEGAANLHAGAELLQYHFADTAGDAKQKPGIADLLSLLDTGDGKKFLEACAYLNTSNAEIDRTEEGTAQAVKRYLRFFRGEPDKKEVLFRRLARFASRLYLFAFEGLEALAALNNPKVMAAGIRAVGTHYNLPPSCREWLKTPEDPDALVWAFVAAFQQQKLDGGRTRRAWDMEEADDDHADPLPGTGKASSFHAWDEDDAELDKPDFGPRQNTGKGRGDAARRTKKRPAEALASDDEPATGQIPLDSSDDEEPAAAPLDVRAWSAEQVAEFDTMLKQHRKQRHQGSPRDIGVAGTLEASARVGPSASRPGYDRARPAEEDALSQSREPAEGRCGTATLGRRCGEGSRHRLSVRQHV